MTITAYGEGLKVPAHDYSPSEGAECNRLFCDGRLYKTGIEKGKVFGTAPGMTDFTVDVLSCCECDAEYRD